METKQINWAHEFAICEGLHDAANRLIGAYSRLLYVFPEHKDSSTWDIEASKWEKYSMNIKNLYFATEEEAEAETARVVNEAIKVRALEDKLAKF
jgi:hypothetical protein